MEIIFGSPEFLSGCVVVGASGHKSLSSNIIFDHYETKFLKEKIEKSDKKEMFTNSFLRNFPGVETPKMINVVNINSVNMTEVEAQELGAKIFKIVSNSKEKEVFVDFSSDIEPTIVAYIASGFKIRSFSFDKYKTKNKDKVEFEKVYFLSKNDSIASKVFEELNVVTDSVDLLRTLSSESPNVLYPESFSKIAKELKKFDLKVEVFDEKDMSKLGMEALLSVGRGSEKESQMVVFSWHGAEDKNEAPIALVGKGVTFDSGGISIKPSNNMHDMKEDMTGAGVVLATMQMIARLKLPINVVGAVGLVENMPSGSAMRPSDIVYSMSGQTIEIQNTDAEGRLVLADVLYYVNSMFKPKCIIDFATLTGAIQVALGHEFAGLFSNSDILSSTLLSAGSEVKERLWRLPLDPEFDKDIDSDVADMKNVGSGRGAGSITAAQFLKRFIDETPWAHIDIAAVTLDKKDRALTGSGFTGFGVRLMHAFLKEIIKKSYSF